MGLGDYRIDQAHSNAYAEAESQLAGPRHIVVVHRAASVTAGPMITAAAREHVEGFVANAVEQGAQGVCGGRRPMQLERGFLLAGLPGRTGGAA